ncbi:MULTISPECIES: ATP-dependent helicase [Pseudoalteromonas]|uniref:ATP-dependent helicase n=1 Tax=Pseudoalteromonas TaxID=53246 RepID=UPI001582A9E5|nr:MULTISPECIES: ATP-dependent helicase [Pseudoalteromonas]MDI4652649.1 ATP-dependent helicase [Pseudoalteromonas shioyasakiensis]NUJ38641.1 ATP-dependent helicase [Pseudoalteromonas sp. 0303]
MAFQLAEEQNSIVLAPVKWNIKVIAVPGSGKSTVLVYRVGHLLQSGIDADKILVVMFNDSAAVNFKNDLEQLEYMHLPEVRTYHSYAKKIGFLLAKSGVIPPQKFAPESYKYKQFYKECLALFIPVHLHKKMQVNSSTTVASFTKFNELCKSSLLEPAVVFSQFNYPEHLFPFVEAYRQSENKRKAEQIQFFPDLIYDIIMLHKSQPDLLRRFINKYDVVMVDEYQDANAASHALVKLIAGSRASVNVVGDDDQTIYDFTGASPRFLKNEIDRDFNDVKLFKLTKTFRYGHTAALVANNIIYNNTDRIEKICISGRNDLNTHFSIAHYDDLDADIEQSDLINNIKQFLLDGGTYSDIAILIRGYSSTFTLELALLRSGFPYFISKESKTILDSPNTQFLTDMLVLLSQRSSKAEKTHALQRFLVSFLWGVDGSKLSHVIEMIFLGDTDKSVSAFTESYSGVLSQYEFDTITRRIKAVNIVLKSRKNETGYLLQRLFKEARFESFFNKKRKGHIELKKLGLLLEFYATLDDNIDVVLGIINELKELTTQSTDTNAIQFCTLHKSKGLAWPYVIMAHCEEGVCPSADCGTDPYQIEVERRLFYVGMTRVRKKLTLHLPRDKKLSKSLNAYSGTMEKVDYFRPGLASRFVYESNLLSAVQIGFELYKQVNRSNIFSSDNRRLYNCYLEAVGVDYRISGLGGEA